MDWERWVFNIKTEQGIYKRKSGRGWGDLQCPIYIYRNSILDQGNYKGWTYFFWIPKLGFLKLILMASVMWSGHIHTYLYIFFHSVDHFLHQFTFQWSNFNCCWFKINILNFLLLKMIFVYVVKKKYWSFCIEVNLS